MSRPSSRPSSSPATPLFYRVSDRDLTEVELHSVDSISDLHRTHPVHKGTRGAPPPPAHGPSANGSPYAAGAAAGAARGEPLRGGGMWHSRLQDALTPSWGRSRAVGCASVSMLLLTVALILYYLVQQGGAVRTLAEAVREKQAVSMEISQLLQELRALRHNLTAMRGGGGL